MGRNRTVDGCGPRNRATPGSTPLEYTHIVLQVADHPEQTLVTYSPHGAA
jgi:hypothetical protein